MKTLKGILAVLFVLTLVVVVSCSEKGSIKGTFIFSETTYDYVLGEMLKEYGVEKGSSEYEASLAIIKASYSFESLKNAYGGGDFAFVFDGKGTLSTTISGMTVPVAKYTVNSDGKIYGEDKTYYGYVKDSVFWCAWYGSDDFVIPFTKK